MQETKPKEKVQIIETPKHANIYAALSAFQGELKPMAKNGEVEFPTNGGKVVKFNYTPLGDIMAVIYPLLSKHGLSIRHEITEKGVEAILVHETYKAALPIFSATNIDKATFAEPGSIHVAQDIQKFEGVVENEIRSGIVKISYGAQMKDTGAAITYARRYTLTMVLGISSEDDKDAELLEQSAKNAIQTVYTRFKAGLENSKTVAEVEKSTTVLLKDKASLEKGKAPALGLTTDQYTELLELAEQRTAEITGQNTIE